MARAFFALALLTGGVISSSASAQQVVDLEGRYSNSDGTYQQINSVGTYSNGNTTTQLSLAPTVLVNTQASSLQGGYQSLADITYSYLISGAANAMVPVSIAYSEGTTADGYSADSYALFSTALWDSSGVPIGNDYTYILVCSQAGDDTACNGRGWTGLASTGGQLFGYLPSNTPINIGLQAQSEVFGYLGQSSSATAFVDPQITVLDPNFTLELPEGVGNERALGSVASTLPEPSTWALMLLGFGAIGAALRRKRKTARLPQLA